MSESPTPPFATGAPFSDVTNAYLALGYCNQHLQCISRIGEYEFGLRTYNATRGHDRIGLCQATGSVRNVPRVCPRARWRSEKSKHRDELLPQREELAAGRIPSASACYRPEASENGPDFGALLSQAAARRDGEQGYALYEEGLAHLNLWTILRCKLRARVPGRRACSVMWYAFGRASDLAFVQKCNMSVSVGNVLFICLIRAKNVRRTRAFAVPRQEFLHHVPPSRNRHGVGVDLEREQVVGGARRLGVVAAAEEVAAGAHDGQRVARATRRSLAVAPRRRLQLAPAQRRRAEPTPPWASTVSAGIRANNAEEEDGENGVSRPHEPLPGAAGEPAQAQLALPDEAEAGQLAAAGRAVPVQAGGGAGMGDAPSE
ncbi:hypothetical protein ON010_g4856 [Phytophthora cinnamomi]|nr:hypothetical protein ON010_g4856 [Phytophthora cinnamomi]